jgi:glycosyltransferase involved in cell wall biosynthesis
MGISGEDAIYRKLILEDELMDATTASFKQILNREQANTGILYRRLRRFKSDAVYIWNMKGLSASLPIICQLLNIPIVYDLHNKWLDPISLRMDPWIHWWTKRSGLKAVFQKFISVITGRRRSYMKWMPLARTERYDLKQSYLCSESLKQELLESGVSAVANLPILYPALNTENIVVKREYVRNHRFMWAGRLSSEKGPDIALESVKLLSEQGIQIELDMFAMGEPIVRKEFREQIEDYGLIDQVKMIGIAPGEIYAHYANYDALLYTSRSPEAMPITPIEAMLSGLPTIVSNDGGIKEVIHNDESALTFVADDVESLVSAIKHFLTSSDAGLEIAEKANNVLLKELSFGSYVSEVESCLLVS